MGNRGGSWQSGERFARFFTQSHKKKMNFRKDVFVASSTCLKFSWLYILLLIQLLALSHSSSYFTFNFSTQSSYIFFPLQVFTYDHFLNINFESYKNFPSVCIIFINLLLNFLGHGRLQAVFNRGGL